MIYSKLDNRDATVEFLLKQIEQGKNNVVSHASTWRMSVHPLKNHDDLIQGFTARFFHNNNGYPTKSSMNEKSQLRYRKAINELEMYLIEKGIKYELRTE